MRRSILALFGCALAFGSFGPARAVSPERPIRFNASGTLAFDAAARGAGRLRKPSAAGA